MMSAIDSEQRVKQESAAKLLAQQLAQHDHAEPAKES